MSEPIKIKLSAPIKAHDDDINELVIRSPKGKDFKKITGNSVDRPFELILDFAAHLAGIPPSSMNDLESQDVAAIVEVVGPFLDAFRPTGKT